MKNINSLSDLIFGSPTPLSSTFPNSYTHRGFFESTADEQTFDGGVRVDVTLTKDQMESLQVGKEIELQLSQAKLSGADALMDAALRKASVTLSEFDPGFVDFKVELSGLGEMISSTRLSSLCAPRQKSTMALV